MGEHDMITAEPYQPSRSFYAKVKRRLTQYRQAAPVRIELDEPVLSITFDDCPASAVDLGMKILDRHGVKGGFYIATGLMGHETHMGPIAGEAKVRLLRDAGHEVGAHSHAHIDYAVTDPSDIEMDIQTNLDSLEQVCSGDEIESFAFPYGETSFEVKKQLSGRFSNLRGVLPGINRGRVDRAQLFAYELDGNAASLDRAIAALDDLKANPGWMLVFTHDVSDTPSAFGISPEQLDRLIVEAKSRGIRISPPALAARQAGVTR